DAPGTERLGTAGAEGDHIVEVVAGDDVHDREGQPPRPERLHGQAQHHARVLAAGEEEHRSFELGRDLADDVDRLGLERLQVRELVRRRHTVLRVEEPNAKWLRATPGLSPGARRRPRRGRPRPATCSTSDPAATTVPPPDGSNTSVNRFPGRAVKGQRARYGAQAPKRHGAHAPTLDIRLTPRLSRT